MQALEPRLCLAGADPTVIDLLAFYTPDASRFRGGDQAIEDLIGEAVNTTNLALQNSLVPIVIRLVEVERTGYPGSGDIDFDYDSLVIPDDGFMDEAHTLRDAHGADLVTLITALTDGGGLGDLLDDLTRTDLADYAFTVVDELYIETGDTYLAHELGHNLGGGHERDNFDDPAVGPFPYSYGHRFSAGGGLFHDIMSYEPGVEVPYFANPDVLFKGVPTGSAEGNPDAADLARTFRATAPVVAAYRPSVHADTSAPTVSLYDAQLAGHALTFRLRFRDDSSLSTDSITSSTDLVRLRLPDGSQLPADLLEIDGATNAFQRLATYRAVLPPNAPAVRALRFELQAGKLRDVHGNVAPAQQVNDGYLGLDVPDSAGQTLPSAHDLGALAARSHRIVTQSLNANDLEDVYSFRLDSPAAIGLTLSGLADDVDADLFHDANDNGEYDRDELIAFTGLPGNASADRSLSADLAAGTYYVSVFAPWESRLATPYALSIRNFGPDVVPPTVTLLDAPDLTTAGGAFYDFAVTYADDNELDGFSTAVWGGLKVSGVLDDGGVFSTTLYPSPRLNPDETNAQTKTVYYRFTAPDGVSGFTAEDNGLYTLSILPNGPDEFRVADTAGNEIPLDAQVGSFRIAIGAPADTAAPRAVLQTPTPEFAAGAQWHELTVIYTDDRAIDVSTLGDGDLRVTGPNGYDQLATLISIAAPPAAGSARAVTYRIPAPGGTFDAADDGAYTVSLAPGEVLDASGNPASAAPLGTLSVSLPHYRVAADGSVTLSGTAGDDRIVFDPAFDPQYALLAVNDRLVRVPPLNVERLTILGMGGVDALDVRAGAAALGDDMHLSSLSLGPTATLDVRDRQLAIHATPQTRQQVLEQVTAWVRSARNAGPQLWQGVGLTTGSATDARTTLAVALNDHGDGTPLHSTFAGGSADADTVLVRFTHAGDADLDGETDISDFFAIDQGKALRRAGFAGGDFNYSGGVPDADDYMLLDRAFLSPAALAAATPALPLPAPPAPDAPEADLLDRQDGRVL